MKLNLQKPLVIFDLETTGLDMVKDRVIQISYIKVFPDGREVRGNELVNCLAELHSVIKLNGFIYNELVTRKFNISIFAYLPQFNSGFKALAFQVKCRIDLGEQFL